MRKTPKAHWAVSRVGPGGTGPGSHLTEVMAVEARRRKRRCAGLGAPGETEADEVVGLRLIETNAHTGVEL